MADSYKDGLEYRIADQVLEGILGGVKIRILAGCGGRAGSTKTNPLANVAQNPCMTDLKHVKGNKTARIGGPLPCGLYKMKATQKQVTPKKGTTKFIDWIALEPEKSNLMFGRGGFAIHGRGEIGSQGCIVPYSASEFKKLYDCVKSNNGGILKVSPGDVSSVLV